MINPLKNTLTDLEIEMLQELVLEAATRHGSDTIHDTLRRDFYTRLLKKLGTMKS